MNAIEFKSHFTLDRTTGKYIPTVSLCDADTNKVIGTKSFQTTADAECYKRLAVRRLLREQGGLHDIIGGFGTDKWFISSDNSNNNGHKITDKETFDELADVLEDLMGSVSIYLRKD